ncbi:MAG: amino acid permease [Candidatus Omnitrophica bacterium]|nr:amino acid permease [Candidatus Omnitrophota bacterium]
MLKRVDRPRELKWTQAAAMLYGDWGTSKAYVLGIAFALAGHASWLFLGLMSLLTAMIGVCYTVICRVYPDGGGVYSSVKSRSQILAVIGALLLIADYVITASLSALDAFHYLNFPHPEIWAVAAIVLIGAINWLGPSRGGDIALVIGLFASAAVGILFVFTVPSLSHVTLTWPSGGFFSNWTSFVGIVLALSGVEAVANMTGIMVEPVGKTSKRAVWPVLLEVSIFTFLLGLAMNAIPGLSGHTEDMLRVLGDHYVGKWFGNAISLIFGFLLLSAVNTAIGDFVSIQFLMSKDRELPQVFSRLNRFGMPALALILATLVPALVLVIEHDLVRLAALYAIGVVGAITMNLGSCATNPKINLKKNERLLLGAGSFILLLIELTIAWQKHHAVVFASIVVATGLILRAAAKVFVPVRVTLEVPSVEVLTIQEAREIAPLYRSSSLVAIRTLNEHLLNEAALRAKAMGERSIYLNVVEESPVLPEFTELEPSAASIELLSKASQEIEKRGVNPIPLWQMGENPGKLISSAAKELGVNTVIIGSSRRSSLIRLLRGDVLRTLAKTLPRECHLAIVG